MVLCYIFQARKPRWLCWLYKGSYRFTKYSFDSQHSPSASCYFLQICGLALNRSLPFHTPYLELSFLVLFLLCANQIFTYTQDKQTSQINSDFSELQGTAGISITPDKTQHDRKEHTNFWSQQCKLDPTQFLTSDSNENSMFIP